MRVPAWCLLCLLAGCKPSATYESTMPVANLQSYRTVGLRVHTNAFAAQGRAAQLESSVIGYLRAKCGFQGVDKASGAPTDLVLDLNITGVGRGGGGMISNPNLATVDALLVLTDGINGDLLGTAKIRGKSSGMMINNSNPENEAIDVVAKTIVDTMAKSGCSGPRIARIEPTPPPTPPGPGSDVGSAVPPPVDEAKRAEADALNQQGKEKLYAADLPGALASFQQANTLVPDARYEFNVCLVHGAQEQWADAKAACQAARQMNPTPDLAAKIDQKIEQLAKH